MNAEIDQAVIILNQGGIIAYPTEGCYGLGCDPFNQSAVKSLLKIKQRPESKGLILVVKNWHQVQELTTLNIDDYQSELSETWPGPVSWVFPASEQVPHWIKGNHESVVLRMSAHPVVNDLLNGFGKPLVSTSANRSEGREARTIDEIGNIFGDDIHFILSGNIGPLDKPTPIFDILTKKQLR